MLKQLIAGLGALLVAACGASDSDSHAKALAAVDAGALLVDVRSPEEFAGGHLEGAINIPHPEIVAGLKALNADPDDPVVLYCRSGNRSGIAATSLREAGYAHVTNAGGYEALAAARAADES